ncbi:hypothetical protein BD410DRAFT_798171 [Rickenella mellea]|uniref:Uncharacterized protein n=1 Tax=Rickenella mellea TaxID=50990 RepID=A0A4R5XFS1_9AGAM|nr:hypothetical protein BD410DRAFT_798171 [Rickenella mellea]
MRNTQGENVLPEHETEDWMSERSKEELARLLHKAETVIQEREADLGLASAACKALVENNLVLKNKHDAFVSQLPVPDSAPGSPSPAATPVTSEDYPPMWRPTSPPPRQRTTTPAATHRRQMSASPSDLAILADQNAELMSKLQDLESDAARADAAGRQKLRALERELRGLKDELEETRARSQKLEDEVRSGDGPPPGLDGDILRLWKKLDREARVRALKAQARPWDKEMYSSDEPRDFAPSSLDSSPPRLPRTPDRKDVAPRPTPADMCRADSSDSSESFDQSPTPTPTPSGSMARRSHMKSDSTREFALVSQLLLKIRELEEANDAIAAQHAATVARVQAAEREADRMRRDWEAISEDADMVLGVEMVVEGPSDDNNLQIKDGTGATSRTHTLRFRSLSKSELSALSLDAESFGRGIGAQMTSTWRNGTSPPNNTERVSEAPLHAHHANKSAKPRGTLAGLFAPSIDTNIPSGPSFLVSPSSEVPDLSFDPFGFLTGSGSLRANKSANSNASFVPHQTHPTLGAELGNANFVKGDMRYLRSASLCEFINTGGDSEAHAADANDEKQPLLNEVLEMRQSKLNPASSSKLAGNADCTQDARVRKGKSDAAYALLMELWLWLQFAVVISVFVFKVVRVGPKEALQPHRDVTKQRRVSK